MKSLLLSICLLLSAAVHAQWANNTNGTGIYTTGRVGIGTAASDNLDVSLSVYGGSGMVSQLKIGHPNSASGGYTNLIIGTSAHSNGYTYLEAVRLSGSAFGNIVMNPSGGNILIGKTSQANGAYKLDVNGSVRCNEVIVNTTGADFVFNDDYKLRPLAEVAVFIKSQKHLPDIESADEMVANGLDLGKMDVKLLQKIEELTLYMIDLKNQVDEVKAENVLLKKQVETLTKN